ncbi:MAG: hypothetical protein LBS49_07345 [Candidatus Accumulibacter sp.]|jgi:hypothetical protein|nr:hypothetical protein [Accumulibacter sp.]
MKIKRTQVAAALAAVDLYLREEEAAALSAGAESAAERIGVADPGFWAQAGRMEAMGVRRMMQMRAFASIR